MLAVLGIASITMACGDDARPTSVAYRLLIEPCQGAVVGRASAAAVTPELLATAAHGLDGAMRVDVADAQGRSVPATVVYLDLAKDVALLAPDRPLADHLPLSPPPAEGSVGILTYGEVDGPAIERGEIIELVDVTLDGEGRRAAIRLAATIDPGDSGAAVLDGEGRMVGMVFASARADETGWAVSSTELTAAIEVAEGREPTSILPSC